MPNQLEENSVLRANLEAVQAGPAKSPMAAGWYSRLNTFLTEVRSAVPTKLKDRDFLRRLWDDNPVAAIGNGTVKIGPALDSDEFVDWFAQHAAIALPKDPIEAEATIGARRRGCNRTCRRG